jgi:Uma2 family endonuclease
MSATALDPTTLEPRGHVAGRAGAGSPSPSQLAAQPADRFLLEPAAWQNYILISDGVGERRVRVTFDGRRVEIMAVSALHEFWKKYFSMLFEVLCKEAGLRFRPFGSMTIRRPELERGFEPDDCYYIRRVNQVRGKIDLDPNFDPAPDFAIEIEISRSMLDRLAILAAVGVLEVWRFDGARLTVMLLGSDGSYSEADESALFPRLALAEFAAFAVQRATEDFTDTELALKEWLRTGSCLRVGNAPV